MREAQTSRFIPLFLVDVCGCPPFPALSAVSAPSGTDVARAGCAADGNGEESLVVGATVAAFSTGRDLRGGIVSIVMWLWL